MPGSSVDQKIWIVLLESNRWIWTEFLLIQYG